MGASPGLDFFGRPGAGIPRRVVPAASFYDRAIWYVANYSVRRNPPYLALEKVWNQEPQLTLTIYADGTDTCAFVDQFWGINTSMDFHLPEAGEPIGGGSILPSVYTTPCLV